MKSEKSKKLHEMKILKYKHLKLVTLNTWVNVLSYSSLVWRLDIVFIDKQPVWGSAPTANELS